MRGKAWIVNIPQNTAICFCLLWLPSIDKLVSLGCDVKKHQCRVLSSHHCSWLLDFSLLKAWDPIEAQLETGCDYDKYIIRMWERIASVVINQIGFFPYFLFLAGCSLQRWTQLVIQGRTSLKWIYWKSFSPVETQLLLCQEWSGKETQSTGKIQKVTKKLY